MSQSKTVVRNSRKRGGGRPPRDTTKQDVSKFAGDAYDLARRAYNGVKMIKDLINIETKTYDVAGFVSPSTTWGSVLLTGIPEGTDIGNRVGDSIKLQNLRITFSFEKNGVAAMTRYRYFIVRDNQCHGSTPAIGDILASPGFGWVSPMNIQAINGNRFSILYDSKGCVDTAHQHEYADVAIPHNGHIKYGAASAGIADCREGTCFLFYYSNEVASTPVLSYYWRMYYTDD
jgi:hypothetical protein